MIGSPAGPTWRPTGALVRALLVGSILVLAGILLGHPALVVLASPFVVFGIFAVLNRPSSAPEVSTGVEDRVLAEGGATTAVTTVTGEDVEQVTRLIDATEFTAVLPPSGAPSRSPRRGESLEVRIAVSRRRWGFTEIARGLVALTSRWGGYRWGPVFLPGTPVATLPSPLPFDSRAETPRPSGLVGANRGSRNGDGTEFSGIREFQAGDRLRRIHWRTSLRTGRLHTITTLAEQDSEVLLLVDALAVHGESGGIDGSSSSLDTSVRAAAALADHHLRIGNRVGMRVVGGTRQVLRPAAGRRHQRRILETLARVSAGPWNRAPTRLQLGTGAGSTVLVLSPLLSPLVINTIVDLGRRGLPVVAIDTMPAKASTKGASGADSTDQDLALRLRLLQRRNELIALERTGIPVVAWRGPGTLDEVMFRLARRAQMPRAVVR